MKRLISSILVIAMMLTMIPAAIAASTDFELKLGDVAAYTVEPNGTVDVPVYFKTSDGVTDKLGTLQTYVVIPEGFTAEVVAGSLGANALSVDAANGIVKAMGIIGDGYTNDTPAFTIKFTAPATAGEYAVAYSTAKKYATKLYNRETLEKFDAARYTLTETSITVVAGQEPPAPVVTLESITVNPTAFEVPYGVDAKVAVEDAITGVTALYSDGTTKDVTGYEVTVDGDVATVTYEGKTATIALTFAEPPVTDVEIVVNVTEIEVPYGTDSVFGYILAQIGSVQIKNSKGELRTEKVEIAYDADASVAIVSYGELEDVIIPVTVVTIVDYTIGGITGVIEIPYDCADAAEYVKGIISVVGNLSNGGTTNVDFTVEVNDDWTAANVFVNGVQIEVVDTKKGEAPVAAITGIKVEVADAIVVPYGTDDVAAYIKSKIVVKTVDEDGVENAISEYTVEAKDGYADITFGEFTESVDFTVETAQLVANVTAIEIPYTVAEADYAAYIAQNVALTIDYSANTADKAVVATAADVVIDVDVAVITIEGLVVNVPFTVQAAPEYFDEAVPAYGLEGKVLVKITGVADGKVAVVNGLQATYFGNGNFAVVVDEAYTVELVEVAAMPAVAEFGKLHPAGVTAWDALVTNDEALEKDVEVFEDIQMYVLADLDGNGKIEAIDALNINKISLFQGAVNVPTWVDAE